MGIVILHDWLTCFRGGERVLDAICEMYPQAPVYTLIHKKGATNHRLESKIIKTSFLNRIPGIHKHYRKFLPLFPKAVESLSIPKDTKLVISSSHCVIKGVRKNSNAKHICYIHSPMRYLYDQYKTYFGPHSPLYQRLGMKIFKNYLVNWDLKSNENVDIFVANSQFVRKRVKTYYGRESDVIHPFVDLDEFREKRKDFLEKKDFYLMVSAFAPNKRVDLAIESFNENKKPLKIIGQGQQCYLKKNPRDNIAFLGRLNRQEVINYLFQARGLVFPGIEDFGITPLEALAAGTPVIAYRKGGVLETLNEKVCEFFDNQTPADLNKAVERFEKKSFSQKNLWEKADSFSREAFLLKFQRKIEETMLMK